ncbi:hypothetical protein NMG60_11027451 [Bertholletia excelsa]
MAITEMRSLAVMVLVTLLLVMAVVVAAAPSASQCKEERRLGLNACKPVLYGKLPSPGCCQRTRVGHIECVCHDITPKLAALVDVNRFLRLIEERRSFVTTSVEVISVSLALYDIYVDSYI